MDDHKLEQELKLSSSGVEVARSEQAIDYCQEQIAIKLVLIADAESDQFESLNGQCNNASLSQQNSKLKNESLPVGPEEPVIVPETAPRATPDAMPDPMQDTKTIGNFQLGDLLGAGSLGKIYRARNILTNADFAMKVIWPEYCRTDDSSAQMQSELRSVSSIINPGLCAYYDCGQFNNSVYLLTDLLVGKTLKDIINSGEQIDSDRLIEIFKQICKALKILHQQNIVHGNLKPSNIFLHNPDSKGHDIVKITDFGFFAGFSQEQRDEFLRRSSGADAAINYMSPEQCLGYSLDSRSDIYSLGLIMHEMLTGAPLASGQSQMHSVIKQLNLRPRSIRETNRNVPESLEKIVMRCLEKNRSSRYISISDLELDLDLAAAAVVPSALSDEFSSPPPPPRLVQNIPKNENSERLIKVILSAVIGLGVFACMALALGQISSPRYYPPRNSSIPPLSSDDDAGGRFRERPNWEGMLRNAEAQISAINSRENALGRQNNPVYSQFLEDDLRILEERFSGVIGRFDRRHPRIFGYLDRDAREAKASILQELAEIQSRGTLSDEGGLNDRDSYFAPPVGEFLTADALLAPSFPGLSVSSTLVPDFVSAKRSLDSARELLEGKYDLKHVDLLWDSCFVESNLGHKIEAINLQQKIVDVYNNQSILNQNALIICHDNLGRMFLSIGDSASALVHFNKASELDASVNKLGQGDFSEQIPSDLAFAQLSAGRWDKAAKLAQNNLKSLDPRSLSNAELIGFNTSILVTALKKSGREEQANDIKAKYLAN